MKTTKKFAAILLALVLALALCVPAFAETIDPNNTSGKITINNTEAGHTYRAYRLLDLVEYDKDTKLHLYKVNPAWEDFFSTTGGIRGVYVNIDEQGYVSWVTKADVGTFARLAMDYAVQNDIQGNGSVLAEKDKETFIDSLRLGYYLVTSSMGTLCSLDTANGGEVTIQEKNAQPTLEKEVQEDSKVNDDDKGWGATNDGDVGDVVRFQATITTQKGVPGASSLGAVNYVYKDVMSSGLTFEPKSVELFIKDNATAPERELPQSDPDDQTIGIWSLITTDIGNDTFHIKFGQKWLDTLKGEEIIIIRYSATINANAVIGGAGNSNKGDLWYGEQGQFHTGESETRTYVWDLQVLKVDAGDKSMKLAGAEFVLYREKGDGTKEYATFDAATSLFSKWVSDEGDATKLVTGTDGILSIKGLDSGAYWLKETTAPKGYNPLIDPIPFYIETNKNNEADLTVTHTVMIDGPTDPNGGKTKIPATATNIIVGEGGTKTEGEPLANTIEIENRQGTELPSTGGIGTTIFYIIGGILVLGAVVLLVTKKRVGNAE